jgi:hypothetical protein
MEIASHTFAGADDNRRISDSMRASRMTASTRSRSSENALRPEEAFNIGAGLLGAIDRRSDHRAPRCSQRISAGPVWPCSKTNQEKSTRPPPGLCPASR